MYEGNQSNRAPNGYRLSEKSVRFREINIFSDKISLNQAIVIPRIGSR